MPRPIEKVLGAIGVVDDQPAPSNETMSARERDRLCLEGLAALVTDASTDTEAI